MQCHILTHVPFEGPACIRAWLRAAGWTLSSTSLFRTTRLPALGHFDLLVVMGGPMSVHDEHEYPWLVAEKDFLSAALAAGKAVLGVCLGAQLIAHVLGARVVRNPEREIGWFPLCVPELPPGELLPPCDGAEVFHWHGETFDLPPGAVHLAGSAACRNQAFQVGAKVLALQFHIEATPASVRKLVAHARHEMTPGPFVQPEAEVLRDLPGRCRRLHPLMADTLTRLVAAIG